MKYTTLVKKLILIIDLLFQSSNLAPINFIGFRGPLNIYEEIKNVNVSIEKIEEERKQFKSKLNEITTGNPKTRSKDQLNTIKNI